MIKLTTHLYGLGLLALLLAYCPTSDAATIHQGFTLEIQGGGNGVGSVVPLNRFNPALGNLTTLGLMIEVSAWGRTHPYTNTDDFPYIIASELPAVYGTMYNNTGDKIISVVASGQSGPHFIPPHATVDFGLGASKSNIDILIGPSMAQFIGSQPMALSLYLWTDIYQTERLYGRFDVYYKYEAVPEPSSLALCAPALLALGVLVRRKRLAKS